MSVLIDRKKDVTHFDKSDPRISLKAERAEKDRDFQQTAAGAAGTPAPNADARAQQTTATETQVVGAADAGPLLAAMLAVTPPRGTRRLPTCAPTRIRPAQTSEIGLAGSRRSRRAAHSVIPSTSLNASASSIRSSCIPASSPLRAPSR